MRRVDISPFMLPGSGADGRSHRRGRDSLGHHEIEPIAVDGDGRGIPSVLQRVADGVFGEDIHQLHLAMVFGIFPEFAQKPGGVQVEIASGHRGIGFAFAGQISANVSAKFF